MARTIQEIQQQIIEAKNAQSSLGVLNSTSSVAIWKLWTLIVAVCAWTLENLFDLHKNEVMDLIDAERLRYKGWYKNAALNFMYGYDLVPNDVVYDLTGLTDEQIAATRIVKYVAITEMSKGLKVKVAAEDNTDLVPLTSEQFEAFTAYMERIKGPGVRLKISSGIADNFRSELKIYYNPLILDGSGKRRDGTNDTPVLNAVEAFLKSQPFNGLFVIPRYEDALQAIDGVVLPQIISAQAQYADTEWIPIELTYLPSAGYMRLITDGLTITYEPMQPLD